MLDRSTAHVFVAAEVEALAHAERKRLIAEAQATSEACSGGARACREHRQEPAHDRHVR